jgi:hypothetical protein
MITAYRARHVGSHPRRGKCAISPLLPLLQLKTEQKFEIRCLDQRLSPRPASWHKFTVDGTHVADKILKGDAEPFAHGPTAPLMFLPDVAVEGGRRPLMFVELELTGAPTYVVTMASN